MMDIQWAGTWKAIIMSFQFSTGISLPSALAMEVDAEVMIWVAPWLSFHFPLVVFYHLLGTSDGMDCCPVSFHDAKIVMDDVGPGS